MIPQGHFSRQWAPMEHTCLWCWWRQVEFQARMQAQSGRLGWSAVGYVCCESWVCAVGACSSKVSRVLCCGAILQGTEPSQSMWGMDSIQHYDPEIVNTILGQEYALHLRWPTAHHGTAHFVYPDPFLLCHMVLRKVGRRIHMCSCMGFHLEETHVIPATSWKSLICP